MIVSRAGLSQTLSWSASRLHRLVTVINNEHVGRLARSGPRATLRVEVEPRIWRWIGLEFECVLWFLALGHGITEDVCSYAYHAMI